MSLFSAHTHRAAARRSASVAAGKGKGNLRDRHFCGGSLLSPDIVMTAAHCVDDVKPEQIEAVVGQTVLSNKKQGHLRNVRSITLHPRYNGDYDVAFLELAKRVYGIAPVNLPTRGTDALIRPDAKATVTGWGNADTE